MVDSEIIRYTVSILVGIATAIPLIFTLVKYIKKFIKERNWAPLMNLLSKLIAEAETLFKTNAERKEWVMAMIKASADALNYEYDENSISDLVDALVAMSKVVNVAPKD